MSSNAWCRVDSEAFGIHDGPVVGTLPAELLSVRTVRNLEAGRGGPPRLETQRLAIAALGGTPTAQPEHAAAPPAQLPADIAGFVGRADQLRRLDTMLDRHRAEGPRPVVVSAIAGTAGVGKPTQI